MPFTFAHPAAVVPLPRLLGKTGVVSALVIGSIVPDIAYIIPLDVARHESHSLSGIVWYCLPISVLLYVVYHRLLKGPLLGLLPTYALQRLGSCVTHFHALPDVPWRAVVFSLLCGILTHIAWDNFTHVEEAGVMAVPALKTYLFSVGGYSVFAYKLLQHGSSFGGMAFIGWWSLRWLERAPVQPVALPIKLLPSQRFLALLAIIGLPAIVGLWAGWGGIQPVESTSEYMVLLRTFLRPFVEAALPTLALTLVVFSLGWHTVRWRSAQVEPVS